MFKLQKRNSGSQSSMMEFNERCRQIVLGCKALLSRRDKETTKRIRESMVGFGIELDELNKETEEILENQ